LPIARPPVINVATAGEPLRGWGEPGAPSMVKVTVPVAIVLPPLQVTVAAKVTGWPMFDGFGADMRTTDVVTRKVNLISTDGDEVTPVTIIEVLAAGETKSDPPPPPPPES
jgi:hypothetical protein